ncbi:8-amino-7-oxononanoate synthase [Diplodia corticola]|uniref:8-amino-7-oxononanoate synthase n=1 Tax=Diplodia corticola TaxID=236234 RepID=A0A1J9RZK5_9PEZI|nr:8-amino-7-oxononanoate synthase [Diplodia corticola]OJD38107.1 8-amino-7-oxononanoate synthase [Diplodia corticola]
MSSSDDNDQNPPPPTGLETTFSRLLSRRRSRSLLRRLTTAPPGTVDFSSNDYLSLSTHPEIRRTFLSLLQAVPDPTTTTTSSTPPTALAPSPPPPPPPIGSRGSRLLDGNTPLATRLESLIAAHHRAPAGLLFNSGFDANAGFFSCVPQSGSSSSASGAAGAAGGGDYIVYDEFIHASVHDGMRLSRVPAGRRVAFAHNSVAGLRGVLEGIVGEKDGGEGERVRRGEANVFVAVEAVYSMDGDVAPLREMLDVVEEVLPAGNGYVVVDEAHAAGVFGEEGRGLACEVGVERRVFARVVTFGKALGSQGAIILCTPLTRSYLINYARPLIYTTALSHPSLASILATYTFLTAGKTAPLLTHLHTLTRHLHALLTRLISHHHHHHPGGRRRPLLALSPLPTTTLAPSPILPIFTPHPRHLAACCQRAGYTVRAIVAPTVPRGQERVRVCLHAGNTLEEVEGLVGVVGRWVGERCKELEGGEGGRREGEGGGAAVVVAEDRVVLEKARL